MARLVRFASGTTATLSGVAVLTAAGCASREPNAGAAQAAQSPTVAGAADARVELTRLVAASKDRHFTADYAWSGPGRKHTVTVTRAADGTWRVDVPGGALGGQANVSLVGRPEAVYQCASGGCVRIAKTAQAVPARYDVKVHHPFTDWPSILTDRDAALAVALAARLPGATGTCFSVEPTTVAVVPPIDPGVFCYDDTGLPTAVRTRFGTLALAGTAAAAPPTAALTGPVGTGPALPLSRPPTGSQPSTPGSSAPVAAVRPTRRG